MRRLILALGLFAGMATAQDLATVTAAAEDPSVMPDGEGRDEVFYGCTACHSSAVIRRSRLSRAQWERLMDWMAERHGMPPLEGQDRAMMVEYLARNFGPAQAPARGRNPFLN